MFVVVDTNVLVSAALSREGKAQWLLRQIYNGVFRSCYDDRLLAEYREVLHRPKFNLHPLFVDTFLEWYAIRGIPVIAPTLTSVQFNRDPTDKPFFEVAKATNAFLITGNMKHYPDDPLVISLSEFYTKHTC